jgi:hypothetical protein
VRRWRLFLFRAVGVNVTSAAILLYRGGSTECVTSDLRKQDFMCPGFFLAFRVRCPILIIDYFLETNTMKLSPIILLLFAILCFDYAAQTLMLPANAAESV